MRVRKSSSGRAWAKPVYETRCGRAYLGKAEEVLRTYPVTRRKGKVQMIFTSPPFPLNRKKKYGNLKGEQYIEWLAGFSQLFKEYLTSDGSIVMEGPASQLANNVDIKEFYLGIGESGGRRSYRDVKHYRRRKRWLS